MKMIFMGRKKYAAECLQWTVSQGIKVVGVVTDSHFANSPTAKKAKELGIPIFSMEEAEEYTLTNKIDVIVSYLFWQKIRKPLIKKPIYGCINFHPALLPDWRGTAGYNIAILKKLNEWGATAHYVDESIDTGDIIKVYKFNFDYREETAYTLERKTQEIQVSLYKSVILDILKNGKLKAVKQSHNEGVYISREQMEAMKEIDIEKDDIDLKIKAFWYPPYDGAYIKINNKKYTLVNNEILKQLQDKETTSIV